jgi:outer membrane protein assembly factor BamA/autotransporter translocation and assembly factor TamB
VAIRFPRSLRAVNWRKVAKRAGISVLVLTVLLVVLIHTARVQQFLLRRAENFARAAGYPFTAEEVRLKPFALEMSLHGFAYDKDGIKVDIDQLTLDVPWNPYTAKGISIKSLEADGVRITVVSPEQVIPEPSGKTTALPHFDVERLSIRNASFSYANQATRLDVPSFSIETTGRKGTLKLGAPVTAGPDMTLRIPEVPVQMTSDSLDFGPTQWAVDYGLRKGSGKAIGTFRWAPTVAASVNFDTEPLAIEKWDNVIAQGKVLYEGGVLSVVDFQATRGQDQVTGTAKITDQNKTARLVWKGVRLDPSGVRGDTSGEMDLQWKASDFADIGGTGRVTVNTPEYGRVDSTVRIDKGRAQFDLRAASMGAMIRAVVNAGLDKTLSGNFQITHREYGLITAQGNLRGTFAAPSVDARLTANQVTYNGIGPLNATARATYRNQILDLTQVTAQLKNSSIPAGNLRVNLKTRAIDGAVPEITAQLGDFLRDGLGQIRSSAVISGTLDRPVAMLEASSAGLDIGGTHIDSVEASAGLADDVLQVTRLVARQKEGLLEASGSVNLRTEQTQAQVKVANLQITEVRDLSTTVNLDADVSGSYRAPSATLKGELANVTYAGEAHGNVLVSGTADTQTLKLNAQSAKYSASVDGVLQLQTPYPFTATVTANQSQVQHQQYQFVANGKVQAGGSLEPVVVNTLQLEGFTLVGEGVDLKAAGALDTGIKVDGTANLAALPVENVVLGGQAQIAAVVRGTLDKPEIDGELHTTNATVRTANMPDVATVETAVDFTRDQFSIREMHAVYADARLAITGAGSLKGTGEFSFVAENIRPERIFPDRPLSGLIGVQGQLKVNAPRLDAIEGQGTVTQLELTARDIAFRQVQPGEISFTNQVLSIRNFTLEGAETRAMVAGTADFGTGNLNFDVKADTDLRIVEGFVPESSAFGKIESEISVRGTTSQPDMRGFVNFTDAQLQITDPPLVISGVNARLQLAGNRIQVAQGTGEINGGAFTLTGETGISASGLENAELRMTLKETQLEYPQGLQSEISATLALSGSSPALTLDGNVNILDALYREEIELGAEAFNYLTPRDGMAYVRQERRGVVSDVLLNVIVDTTAPVTIVNNVADVSLSGNFRVRGTIGDPVLLGRAVALDGGEVYFGMVPGGEAVALNERRDRYIIERGIIDFNNPLRTEPELDVEATHDLHVKGETYLVRLRATGTPADLRTELSSDPYLDQRDITAMLLTGKSFEELQQQSTLVEVAREGLYDYLSGQLTSRFFKGAGSALGLDTVTIEPGRLAADDDTTARLTIGKNVTRSLGIIYSQNLAASNKQDQSWIVNYQTVKNFVLRAINRPGQDELRLELRHGLEFGGGPPLPRRVAPWNETKLGSVTFEGSSFPEEELKKHVGKVDKPYSITHMHDDVRALREFLGEQNRVDAKVRARRSATSGLIDVTFLIEDGPPITFEYRGAPISKDMMKEVVEIWVDGLAEAASLKESLDYLLRYFRDDGYLQARVSAKNESANPNERHYVYTIEPGMRFPDPKWVFRGIEPLKNVSDSAGTIMAKPEAIRDQIEFELRAQGFLDAKSTVPELVFQPEGPRFVVSVDQGLQYIVSALHHEGNEFYSDEHLTGVVILGPTRILPEDEAAARPPAAEAQLKPFPYTSDWVSIARRRIMTEYWQEGFNDVQIGAKTDYVPGSGRIEISFDIKESRRQAIAEVKINGAGKTKLEHVRRYLRFSQGDPVDYGRINLTRKKLYDTGLFKRVEIPIPEESQGFVAHINLNERAPWSFKYGITGTDHQSHKNIGLSTEASHRNIFGKGILAGVSLKYDATLREARFFNSIPVFMDRDVMTTTSLFRNRETLEDAVANTWGFTAQQQWRLSDYYMLSYDYSFRRVGTFDRDLTDDILVTNGVIPVGRFNVTISRDTRDDILNATRGTSLSNSFDLAPPGVGSSIRYIRNYTQYLRFREIRPNLIWASAYRVGVARAFGGGQLVATDQFRTGGSSSLRAFTGDEDTLNPGNALIVMNQELRRPLFWRIGVVGFLDVGNVFDRVGTTRVFSQRYSPGVGLRLDTSFILLRVDMGLNLWPRTGEDRRTISFGIGQAF